MHHFIYRTYLLLLSISCLFLYSCTHKKDTLNKELSIDEESNDALGVYMTQNHKGNLVLCWTAKAANDSLYKLKYSVFDSLSGTFKEIVTINTTAGLSTSAESMGKVAFKSDGTIIALFSKRFENEKNPYAGAIYYTSSNNNGRNWSTPQFLHSDTSHTYGRSFFDVANLKNGEIAAIWLDGRFGKSIKGSALYFSKTTPGKGFDTDTCLNKGTCECCRTDLLVSDDGKLHAAYRSIQFPGELLGKQVRDMVYIQSTDNGKTFSAEKRISHDNWAIDGCPHSGPTLAADNKLVRASWFTAAEGKSGIYYSSLANSQDFQKRSLISANGRHPQMALLAPDKIGIVYEEDEESSSSMANEHQHSEHSNMLHKQLASKNSKIVLKIMESPGDPKELFMSPGNFSDHHPMLHIARQNVLIAWVRTAGNRSKIFYKTMDISTLQ